MSMETDTRPIRTASDAASMAAQALRSTLAQHGATATIQSGEHRATIAPDGISGHVTEQPEGVPHPPQETAFGEGDDFLAAPEVAAIAEGLIAGYSELRFITDAEVRYLWKRKGGKSKGKPVFGQCVKPGGLTKHFAACDFVIWLAADHVAEWGFTNRQLTALIYHELCHVDVEEGDDGALEWAVRGHDNELFVAELDRFGAWNVGLKPLQAAFQQLAL